MKKVNFYFGKRKVSIECEVANSSLKRAIGIMFKKKFKPLLFEFGKVQKISIHSFFCQPFIAIFLNSRKRVVQIEKIRPFSLFTSRPAKYLIEMPISRKTLSLINFFKN
jgi:uncharacterized membrane protein (UPF0127 family)